MIVLVSGGTTVVRACLPDDPIGILVTPRTGNSIAGVVASGRPWAADNDCFQRLRRTQYIRMLRRIAGQPRLLWVPAPDVVGNAQATLARFHLWLPVLRYYDLPVAFVAQDGQEQLPVPWNDLACLFIGGTTAWKESLHAAVLVKQAKDRNKWVHVGRVNSKRRERLFVPLGVDSIDGTGCSRWGRRHLPPTLLRLNNPQQHLKGFLDAPKNLGP